MYRRYNKCIFVLTVVTESILATTIKNIFLQQYDMGLVFTSGYVMVYATFKFTVVKIIHGHGDHTLMRSMNLLPTNIKMQNKCLYSIYSFNTLIVPCYVSGTALILGVHQQTN